MDETGKERAEEAHLLYGCELWGVLKNGRWSGAGYYALLEAA